MSLLVFVLGLIAGSFVSAITTRIPKNEDFVFDRSRCDECKKEIAWYDNIPLLSFLVLSGRCRNCHKKISLHYPLLELSVALLFLMIYIKAPSTQEAGGILYLGYLFVITVVLVAIFVIDFKHQIIPDELTFFLISIVSVYNLLFTDELFFAHIFAGFAASVFLFLLHIATMGRGMGLGDVKFAIASGFFFGVPMVITWFFLSFTIGASVGLLLIAKGRAKFGRHIAFGPFLVLSWFIMIFWGEEITTLILPYF